VEEIPGLIFIPEMFPYSCIELKKLFAHVPELNKNTTIPSLHMGNTLVAFSFTPHVMGTVLVCKKKLYHVKFMFV
jgi:hypothetical protein